MKNEPFQSDVQKYVHALLEKSEEAYLMALEIINKPTIKYRTEGFCFFICNAWELLLKAFIINKENNIEAINFKNNPNQTIGLQECVEKIFTSTTDHTKANLDLIREIRNKSTHSVLPEYDFKFSSVFQRCVSNINTFYGKHFPEYKLNGQITAFIALSNLSESTNSPLALNPKSLIQMKIMEENIFNNNNSDAITQTIKLVSTKRESDADLKFSISDDSDTKVHFVNVTRDSNITHPYTATQAVTKIKESLEINLGVEHGFNMASFTNICREKNVRSNATYFYELSYGKSSIKKYSEKLIEYIFYLYSQDEELRNKFRKKGIKKD